jgi:uncharacterized protein YjbI with pentapeptide repeats
MDEWIGNRQWIPPYPSAEWSDQKDWMSFLTTWYGQEGWTSFHDLLFNGKVDDMTRRRKSFFSNTLVLPAFDALEAKAIENKHKLDWTKHTLVLRGRHLESAIFDRADLRKADLESAQLQGASFYGAQLQGASLDNAHLQGASLDNAPRQGASLDNARLQGASLVRAQLQGASLDNARLQGAALDFAQLQGASLENAWLQGARLHYANLQGASLDNARLQGAVLVSAQLQGALFMASTFVGADMRSAALWRTNFERASLTDVCCFSIVDFKDEVEASAISKADFAALKAMIMKEVPEGKKRENALKRVEILNPDIFSPEASEQKTVEARVDETTYEKSFAAQLKSLACYGDEDTLYVVRGLIRNRLIELTHTQAPGLVEAILKPDCPVSALTEADKAALKRIAKEASGPH